MSVNFPVSKDPGVTREDVIDRADEVQLDTVQDKKVEGTKLPMDRDLKVDHEVRVKESQARPMRDADSAEGLKSRIEVTTANRVYDRGGVDPKELQERLTAMVMGAYAKGVEAEETDKVQADFVRWLESRNYPPRVLARISAKVRASLPPGINRVWVLRKWFNAQGVKFLRGDRLEPGKHGLDVRAFRKDLDRLATGEPVDKRGVRHLIASLREVHDKRDLFGAQWDIKRRIREGTLVFNEADQARIMELFEDKLGGEVGRKEIMHAILEARRQGFSEKAVAELTALFEKAAKDPQALFYAEEKLERQIQEAINGAKRRLEEKAPDAVVGEPERLARIGADFAKFFEPRLQGQFNRVAARRLAIKAYFAGDIDRAQTAGLMAAAATSKSESDFAYASMLVTSHLQVMEGWQDIMEAWDELMKTFSRNMSGDTYDSNGNLVERAVDRELRYRREKEQVERVYLSVDEREKLAQHAWLKSGKVQKKLALVQARSPSEARDILAAHVALENADQDIDPVPESPSIG